MQGRRSSPILVGPLAARYTGGMDTPEKRRWYRPMPCLAGLRLAGGDGLAVPVGASGGGWFNGHKGYAVLVAVAGVGVVLLAMLLWWLVGLGLSMAVPVRDSHVAGADRGRGLAVQLAGGGDEEG